MKVTTVISLIGCYRMSEDRTLCRSTWQSIICRQYRQKITQKHNHPADDHPPSSTKKPTRLLDLFWYPGVFSLNSLRSETVHATSVESGKHALAMLHHNAQLNGVGHNLKTLRDDGSQWWSRNDDDGNDGEDENGDHYDIVFIDPPKLAPNTSLFHISLRKYWRINEHAIRRVSTDGEGGIVVSRRCSPAVAQNLSVFSHRRSRSSGEVSYPHQKFRTTPHHVVAAGILETEYLTVCVFAVL